MKPISIRRLAPGDAEPYRRIRLCGLRANPEAFGSSYGEEGKLPLATFASHLVRKDGSWTFGAFAGTRLVGVVTLKRDERRKERHKASVLGMFVEAQWRGQGVGRALLVRARQTAGRIRGLRRLRISVVAGNEAALRLYESLGFRTYGREEESLFVGGKFHAELLLAQSLPGPLLPPSGRKGATRTGGC